MELQTRSELALRGAVLLEVRPSWHLYGTYSLLFVLPWLSAAWLYWSVDPWKWVAVLTGLMWPLLVLTTLAGAWGLGGVIHLARRRLRLHQNGVYQGPCSGRRGTYIPFDRILRLELDIVHFSDPVPDLIGYYAIRGEGGEEIVFFPKLYSDAEELAGWIADLAGRSWEQFPSGTLQSAARVS